MGFRSRLNRGFKKIEKEEQEEWRSRMEQFVEEYKVLQKKHKCHFQPYLNFVDGGVNGIQPTMKIVDITKELEEQENARKLANDQNREKPKL